MMVPGRLRVQVGTVGRPLWGRFDPFTTPPLANPQLGCSQVLNMGPNVGHYSHWQVTSGGT